MEIVRRLVSKKKRRFRDKQSGIDLDLTYITSRVIAMGYPSSGKEAAIRNPISAVQNFFMTRHGGTGVKVYNLCSERANAIAPGSFASTARFPFDDHNACPMVLLLALCESIDAFLGASENHVVGIHCKAGKGRTGLAICAYLLHAGIVDTAGAALELFGQRRTRDGKGVTIPSQQRYVLYMEQLLRACAIAQQPPLAVLGASTRTLRLVGVRVFGVPHFDLEGGCDAYAMVRVFPSELGAPAVLLADSRGFVGDGGVRHWYNRDHMVTIDCARAGAPPVYVRGDVRLTLYDADDIGEDDIMCGVQFHTAFVAGNGLSIPKKHLDGPHKKSSTGWKWAWHTLELMFEDVPEPEPGSADADLNTDAGYWSWVRAELPEAWREAQAQAQRYAVGDEPQLAAASAAAPGM